MNSYIITSFGQFRSLRGVAVLFSLIFFLIHGISPADAAVGASIATRQQHVADEFLVKFRANVSQTRASGALENRGAKEMHQLVAPRRNPNAAIGRWWHAKVPPGRDLRQVMDELRRDPNVEAVEPNYIVHALLTPNDTRFSELWGLHNSGQTGGTADRDIDAPEAWDVQTGAQNTLVAVIDTGVDYNHPDLAANIWTNPGEIAGNGVDDDGNGYVDDVHGYDFVNNDGNPMDDHGHGTHCAGTIAAVGNNGVGVVGVTWRARVMGVKFLNASGSGSTTAAIQAVLYAANNGARVMSNSWGGGGFSQALNDAIVTANQAGALFVAAAGNSNSNNDVTSNYPSNYNVPNVLAVAATDHNDQKASFSSYGATTVDLGAPGVNILSTVPTTGHACCSDVTGYRMLSGTSMATPHVSGAAALLIAQFPGITNDQLKYRLMGTADPAAALQSITVSGARLNILAALDGDSVSPASVTNLAVSGNSAASITLLWSATGDDGAAGTARFYELRYSTLPITETNFQLASLAVLKNVGGVAGTPETHTVSGLEPGEHYYFALKVRDNVGNPSSLSNIVTGTTQNAQVVFSDRLESGTGNWTIVGATGASCPDGTGGPSLWHLSSHRVGSPTYAFYYGIEGTLTYNTGARNCGSITSTPISLASVTGGRLAFQYFLQTEGSSTWDVARVQVSNNSGASWANLLLLPNVSNMTKQSVDLSAYNGQTVQLRFLFDTVDAVSNSYEGWVIDDVAVTALATAGTPVANAGPDQIVNRSVAVALDGTASSDPDGVMASYNWTQTGGTAVTLIGANTANPNFLAPANAGTLTFELLVTDNVGVSATNSVTVRVNADPDASAGVDRTVETGATVNLNGLLSSDPDGLITSYSWVQTGGSAVVLSGANSATPSFTAPGVAATLTFELTVTDNDGASTADTVVIAVNAPTSPPPADGGGGGGGGGGCVLRAEAELDPMLPALLLLATIVLWRRRRA